MSTLMPIGATFLGSLAMGYSRVQMHVNMKNARNQVEDPDGLGHFQLEVLHEAATAAYRLAAKK